MRLARNGFKFLYIMVMLSVFLLSGIAVYAEGEGTWTTKAPMAEKLYHHQVAAVNSKIYVIGGSNGKAHLSSVEEFDPETNKWNAKSSMADKRSSFQAEVINGKIFAIGGNDGKAIKSVEEYNPETDKWTEKAPMSTTRTDHRTAVINGKIYAIGGYSIETGYLSSVEEYDPESNTWTPKAPIPVAPGKIRLFEVAALNGKIYVIGGYDDSKPLSSVEEYDPMTDTWNEKAPMAYSRFRHQLTVGNGKIYAIGGSGTNIAGSNTQILASIEEYDPETNKWTEKAPMKYRLGSPQATELGGKIYVTGGANGGNYSDYTAAYDPAVDTWTTKAPMAVGRDDHELTVVNGKIYVIGGSNGIDTLNSIEEYTPDAATGAPSNLTAAAGDGEVTLSWAPTTGGAIYTVKRAETTGGPYSDIAGNITGTSYTDASVTDGVTYYYVVSASDPSGDSPDSNEASATPRPPLPGIPSRLTASPGNSVIKLTWQPVASASGYNVKRSGSPGGPYAAIASNITGTAYADTDVANGTSYYYVVAAITEGVESLPSNEASATPTDHGVTLSLQSVDRAEIGDIITVDVVINNAVNICAEDLRFDFDTNLLEFMGSTAADGMKLYRETYVAGTVNTYRDVLSCLGRDNAANGSKVLLHLKFKAKQAGQARIDILKGRVADNATLETDISAEDCGEKVIIIGGSRDVNRSGEFTLLDLGIDAWYYGSSASETDTEKYDADLDSNGLIDDVDLAEVVAAMLANENYGANL